MYIQLPVFLPSIRGLENGRDWGGRGSAAPGAPAGGGPAVGSHAHASSGGCRPLCRGGGLQGQVGGRRNEWSHWPGAVGRGGKDHPLTRSLQPITSLQIAHVTFSLTYRPD